MKCFRCVIMNSAIELFSACWRGEFIFVWLFKDNGTHIRISHADDIFRWWDYFKKISIFNEKMGCWWRSWSKALGMKPHHHRCQMKRFSCNFSIEFFPEQILGIWEQIRENIQLGQFWLWQSGKERLCVYAMERALFGRFCDTNFVILRICFSPSS